MKKVSLGEIADVKGGKRLPKGSDVQDEVTDHPYIRVVDFKEDGVNTQSVKYITKEVHEQIKKYIITSDDVYISIAGTIGRVGIVPEHLSNGNLTENAAKIMIKDERIDKRYLMYFLRGAYGQAQIKSKAGGTSQPKLALYRVKEIEIPMPDIKVQKRIVSILSTYDDLIENNLRRISLLEKSADLLYKEWFVNLRFPGFEHTKMSDGIPKGWQIKNIGDVIELKYGKALKQVDRIDGPYPVYGSSGNVGYHNESLVEGPGVIIGRKGNVGSAFWSDLDFYPIDTVYYAVPTIDIYFTYYNLKHRTFLSSDAAVPGLNRNYAYSLPIIVPNNEILTRFRNHIEPIRSMIFKLIQMNQKLRQSRDLLLPKLLNKEVKV